MSTLIESRPGRPKQSTFFSRYAGFVFLILITALSFGRSLRHQFVWDDDLIIIENPHIRDIGNIPSFFFPHYWKYDHSGTKGQYRPLRTVSLALSYRLSKLFPFGYHLTNLIFHILMSCWSIWWREPYSRHRQ